MKNQSEARSVKSNIQNNPIGLLKPKKTLIELSRKLLQLVSHFQFLGESDHYKTKGSQKSSNYTNDSKLQKKFETHMGKPIIL